MAADTRVDDNLYVIGDTDSASDSANSVNNITDAEGDRNIINTTDTNLLLGSHPVEIYLACDRLFYDEPWLQWEPETLLMQLRHEVDALAEDKVLAVQAVASNCNPVLNMAMAFEKVVMAFCNNVCVMDTWQPPYVEEICYAVPQIVRIIKLVHGKDTPVKFDGEVPSYVAGVAKYRGWISLPRRIGFAEGLLMNLNGLTGKSPKYLESRELVDTVREVCHKMGRPMADDILKNEAYTNLSEAERVQFLKIAGALLFDPTVLYRDVHGRAAA